MTITLERRVFNLRAEFFAHTFIFGAFADPARAISAFGFKSVAYRPDHFFIFVKSYSHRTNLPIASATAPSSFVAVVTKSAFAFTAFLSAAAAAR